MLNFTIIASYLIIAVALTVWSLILKGRERYLTTRDKLVSQREANCERRAEILATAEDAFDEKVRRIKDYTPPLRKRVKYLAARYIVTDSDLLKYNSDTAIRNVARNRIAHVIANDLVRKFPDPIESGEGAKKTYEYRFKVAEDK